MSGATWDLAAVLERAADRYECEAVCATGLGPDRACDCSRAADVIVLRAHAAKVRAYCEAFEAVRRLTGNGSSVAPDEVAELRRVGVVEYQDRQHAVLFHARGGTT